MSYIDYYQQLTECQSEYSKLKEENAKLREVLRLHDTVIDELWEACDSNRHLEELIRDAWEKYKEVIGND